MKTLILNARIFLLLFGLLFNCTPNSVEQDFEKDIAAIKRHFELYAQHINDGDLDAFISLWAEDATRMAPDTVAVVGKQHIREQFRNIFEPFITKAVMIGEVTVEVAGDMAFAYGTLSVSSTPRSGGAPIPIDIKWLDVLKRQVDGSWKIYIDCHNFHPSWSNEADPTKLLEKQLQSIPY